MDGTSKIVDEILAKYLEEIAKLETVDQEFVSKLSEVLKDNKAVTASKLEQVIYATGVSL
jgi:nucleoside-triphosphatase THEP1